MLFTNKVISLNQPELFLGREPLETVDSVKYLGIHLENKLKYHKHEEDLGKSCVVYVEFRTSYSIIWMLVLLKRSIFRAFTQIWCTVYAFGEEYFNVRRGVASFEIS